MQNEAIIKIARAGAQFSKEMRNIWTGEKVSPSVREDDYCGVINDLMAITVIAPDLVSYCRLNKVFYSGKEDMYKWDENKWEAEIKERIMK